MPTKARKGSLMPTKGIPRSRNDYRNPSILTPHESADLPQAPTLRHASNQTSEVSEETLLDLKNTLQEEFQKALNDLRIEIQDLRHYNSTLESRIINLENTLQHQDLQIAALEKHTNILSLEIERIDNHIRRPNICIRGIPEDIENVSTYVQDVIQEISPQRKGSETELLAHRLPGHRRADGGPRDVMVTTRSPKIRDNIMMATRNEAYFRFANTKLLFFPDISPMTLRKRKLLKPYTWALRKRGLSYRWGSPFKLSLIYNGRSHDVTEPAEAKSLFISLGLISPQSHNGNQLQAEDRPHTQRSLRIDSKVSRGFKSSNSPTTSRASSPEPRKDPLYENRENEIRSLPVDSTDQSQRLTRIARLLVERWPYLQKD